MLQCILIACYSASLQHATIATVHPYSMLQCIRIACYSASSMLQCILIACFSASLQHATVHPYSMLQCILIACYSESLQHATVNPYSMLQCILSLSSTQFRCPAAGPCYSCFFVHYTYTYTYIIAENCTVHGAFWANLKHGISNPLPLDLSYICNRECSAFQTICLYCTYMYIVELIRVCRHFYPLQDTVPTPAPSVPNCTMT